MKITIDTDRKTLIQETDGVANTLELDSKEAFELISDQWVRTGWALKYSYTFTWMGIPIIQLPEDMLRTQELIYQIQPDVIIETGVAHGGSLIFYASLCKALGKGRVIGVDIEIRPHNRKAIEEHFLFDFITLIEADSIARETVQKVHSLVQPGEKVLVILDSCHTKAHVLAELEAYSPLVSVGSYIVATDGIMGQLGNAPRTQSDWGWNNPSEAAKDFADQNPNFVLKQPGCLFKEGVAINNVTYWPDAWLLRQS